MKLEDELGVTLLARSQRRVALTAAGEAFRARATDAMAAIDHAEQTARRIARGDAGRLVLRFTMATALEGAIGAVWDPITISPVARSFLALVQQERSAMESEAAAAIRRRSRPAKR